MYQYVLFDLDGTLTDSAPGIIRCVQYALEKLDKGNWEAADLFRFIGPPLTDSFQRFCGLTAQEADAGLVLYRERFVRFGMFENSVYDGVVPLLELLKDNGKTLAIATSKPQVHAQTILEHFDLAKYFTTITGPGLNGELPTKTAVITETLRRLNIDEDSKSSVVMLGDREHDAIGAKENGITIFGAGYGYGAPGELEKAGVTTIASAPSDFAKLLLP